MYVPLLGTQQPKQSLDVPHITAKLAAQSEDRIAKP